MEKQANTGNTKNNITLIKDSEEITIDLNFSISFLLFPPAKMLQYKDYSYGVPIILAYIVSIATAIAYKNIFNILVLTLLNIVLSLAYNQILLAKLISKGYRPKSETDTEMLRSKFKIVT